MEQIHDVPDYNRRSQLRQIFTSPEAGTSGKDFVPFNSERDKLGRLIELDGKNLPSLPSLPKGGKSSQFPKTRLSLPSTFLEEKTENAEKTIGRIFKQNGVRGSRSTSQLNRMSIGSVITESNRQNPPQDFEVVSIQDRLKYTRVKQTLIKPPSRKKVKEQTTPTPRLIDKKVVLKHVEGQEAESNEKTAPAKSLRRIVELNMDLPELQRYNRMKKLKTKVVQNFEQNHLRFKELVRRSLILANNIKRGLQLD